MFKFEKCKSSFLSDEYKDINELLRDPSTLKTVNTLKCIQAIQLIIPAKQLDLTKSTTLSYYLNGFYNREDDTLKYLLIKNTPIHFILHPYFLSNYAQKGDLHIQTDNQLDDLDNYISLQDNQLLICVNQVAYTKLGLVGELANGYRKNYNLRKYIIKLDLNDKLFYRFDSKYYQRTFSALKNCGIKLDLLIKWIPNSANNCSPLSLIRFFDLLKYQQLKNDTFFNEISFEEITIHQCAPAIRKFELDQFQMPFIELDEEEANKDKQLEEDEFNDLRIKSLIDSFGLALIGSYASEDADDEVNTFRLDKIKLTNLICIEITGFFTIDNIRAILSELFELIKQNAQLDYTVLIVNDFKNSIRWSGQLNCQLKRLNGENLYGLFLSRFFKNFIWRIGDIERL